MRSSSTQIGGGARRNCELRKSTTFAVLAQEDDVDKAAVVVERLFEALLQGARQ